MLFSSLTRFPRVRFPLTSQSLAWVVAPLFCFIHLALPPPVPTLPGLLVRLGACRGCFLYTRWSPVTDGLKGEGREGFPGPGLPTESSVVALLPPLRGSTSWSSDAALLSWRDDFPSAGTTRRSMRGSARSSSASAHLLPGRTLFSTGTLLGLFWACSILGPSCLAKAFSRWSCAEAPTSSCDAAGAPGVPTPIGAAPLLLLRHFSLRLHRKDVHTRRPRSSGC